MSRNEVALVTGGSGGAGRAVARGLGEAGFAVGILARSPQALEETRALLASDGVPSAVRMANVRDRDEVTSAVGEIADELGPVSVTVNNAGTSLAIGPVWEVDPDDWWADVETSLRGAFNVCRSVIPGMLAQGTGRILNVSSYAGLRAAPYQSGYGSAKAGLANFTESLNSSLRPFGIRAFTVTPGFVRTSLTKTLTESPEGQRWLPELGSREGLDLDLFVRLTVKIALGEADTLDGRFLHALDDLDDLVGHADRIEREDLYVPRLRRLALSGRKGGMRTYVINLERSPERREHMLAELESVRADYEIVTGVDGRDLDLNDRSVVDESLYSRSEYPAGMAGCALSHLRVYRAFMEDGADVALVLEDDVTLPADLRDLADSLAGHMAGAEVVLLNYDSRDTLRFGIEGAVSVPASRSLAFPIDVRQLGSSAAYLITREAAMRMSDLVQPVRVSPDDWWWFYREGALDRVRCVTPLPVLKSPRFGSTIGFYGFGKGLRSRLIEPVVRGQVPVLRQLIAYRRRLIFRQMTRTEVVDVPFVEKPCRL